MSAAGADPDLHHRRRAGSRCFDGYQFTNAAAELGVSFSTINFHMQNIKLRVHSKSEAVAKALRQRLVR